MKKNILFTIFGATLLATPIVAAPVITAINQVSSVNVDKNENGAISGSNLSKEEIAQAKIDIQAEIDRLIKLAIDKVLQSIDFQKLFELLMKVDGYLNLDFPIAINSLPKIETKNEDSDYVYVDETSNWNMVNQILLPIFRRVQWEISYDAGLTWKIANEDYQGGVLDKKRTVKFERNLALPYKVRYSVVLGLGNLEYKNISNSVDIGTFGSYTGNKVELTSVKTDGKRSKLQVAFDFATLEKIRGENATVTITQKSGLVPLPLVVKNGKIEDLFNLVDGRWIMKETFTPKIMDKSVEYKASILITKALLKPYESQPLVLTDIEKEYKEADRKEQEEQDIKDALIVERNYNKFKEFEKEYIRISSEGEKVKASEVNLTNVHKYVANLPFDGDLNYEGLNTLTNVHSHPSANEILITITFKKGRVSWEYSLIVGGFKI